MTSTMPPSHMPLLPKWRHWPTYVYDKNYAYGMNYYQPMIDYIDKKEQMEEEKIRTGRASKRRIQLPELPWSDGRAMWEDKEVHFYDRDSLIRRAIDAEDQARDHLNHFKAAKRSDFSLAKTVEASHVTQDILPKRSKELPISLLWARQRARSESKEVQEKAMADMKLQALKDVQTMREVEDALDHGRSLRGKSARAIEFQLRAEALKNLSKSQELADIRKLQRETAHVFWDERDHARLMEERTRFLIDEDKLTEPLGLLSKELRGYEQKSSNYFLDKRYRDRWRLDRESHYKKLSPILEGKYRNYL